MKLRLTHTDVLRILERYPAESAATIAADYSVHVMTIYKTAQRYKVQKSPEFMASASSGRMQKGQCLSPATQFKKGHVPCFKGKKLPYKPGHLWEKGHKPYNTGKDGEIRWRRNPGYYFIRIAEKNWQFLHRYNWEQKNGPVPAGHNVVFADGNRRNCETENLECISNADLVKRNSIHNYPEDLKTAMRLNSKLNKIIKNETN